MLAGLKKHQPCRARALCAAPPRRWQPSKFAYTVVVRQSAFQGQQRAFTSLMLPGGICNQPLQTARCHPCACCVHCVPASSPWPLFAGASQWGEQCKKRAKSSAKISRARKKGRRRRRNRRSSESAPTCTAQPQGSFFFFRRKTLHVNQ